MRVFLFAILWICAICATAQEFKDAVIYEAAGDIKSNLKPKTFLVRQAVFITTALQKHSHLSMTIWAIRLIVKLKYRESVSLKYGQIMMTLII